MPEFAMLKFNNDTVFEDATVTVTGLTGDVEFGCDGSGTTFVAVAEGEMWLGQGRHHYRLTAGMYACVPGGGDIAGRGCHALVVNARQYDGIFAVAGPLETQGRLKYMDGCTDTGLLQPLRLGDPCLNGLFFPPGISQRRHYHPSHRIGLVLDGGGMCEHDDDKQTPMQAGGLFIIPAHCWHRFETTDRPMRIIAFHPDSEFGPTDESHQMLNATLSANLNAN
jgi:quercetin dioxygenase-like cupin family protein